jgi:hypothetical protein
MDSNFVKMCRQGIIGSFLGIIGGLLLGLVIYFLQFPLLWIGGPQENPVWPMWQTAAQPGMMGACFGAIIGAVFGCILTIKETPKK